MACLCMQYITGQGRKLRWEMKGQLEAQNHVVEFSKRDGRANEGRLLVAFLSDDCSDDSPEPCSRVTLQQDLADREAQRTYLHGTFSRLKAAVSIDVDDALVDELHHGMHNSAIANANFSQLEKELADKLKALGRVQKRAAEDKWDLRHTGKNVHNTCQLILLHCTLLVLNAANCMSQEQKRMLLLHGQPVS